MKIEEYLKEVNLNDYDLGGVEITEEDIAEMKTLVNNGKSIKDSVDEILYGIRKILDEGLEDKEM